MTARKSDKKRSSRQSKLHAIFSPSPLLEHEDAAAYDALLERVSSAVKPTDMIEEIWVRDVVDLTWELFRWRRLCASCTDAYGNGLDKMERIDRLAMMAEGRLISVLREIDRHRSWVAMKLRSTFEEIEDAEFKTVKPKAIASTKATNKSTT